MSPTTGQPADNPGSPGHLNVRAREIAGTIPGQAEDSRGTSLSAGFGGDAGREVGVRLGHLNATELTAGGIYLFADEESARTYATMHTQRLEGFGVTGIRARFFDVNEPLTATTRGPV